jgi:16S rRNA processing protein RimM
MSYTVIAEIVNTHALKGEVSCLIHTDFLDRFENLKNVFLLNKEYEKKHELIIESFRFHKNRVLLKFKNIDDINDVLKYKGLFIAVLEEEKYKLDDKTFYIDDLLGIDVIDSSSEQIIGTVVDCYSNVSNDIIEIKLYNREIITLPFIEKFFGKVDILNRKIYIYDYELLTI